jgi:hypothetical protein
MVAACAVLAGGCHTAPTPPKRMKMTTQIPVGVATPDRLKTSIGTLTSVDGVPDVQTTRLVYDNLDFQRATQAYLASLPIASMYAMREGLVSFGPANTTVVQFQQLMDSKALWLTPNTTSVYMAAWLEMTDEPWVIEAPPNVLGIIDDFWFRYVADFGNAGPDKGQGGKFLVLPPGYEGDVPAGYYVTQSSTYGNWVAWRGFQEEGDPAPAVEATKRLFRMYPLSKKDDPPQMTFVNASGVFHNTIHRMDEGIWEEIDAVVQAEPSEGMDPEILGQLASIGIRKGTPFAPDDRMRGILADAARVAAVTVRALAARPREDVFYFYPGERRRAVARRPQLLSLLRDRDHAGDGVGSDRQGLPVRRCVHGQRRQPVRRRQDVQVAHTEGRTREGLLVVHAVREPDAGTAPDRSAVSRYRQQQAGPDPEQ